MANSLLDRYKLLKKDTPTYGDNSLLSIKEGKLVEPSYSSIISPPSDNTVAQLASTNSMTPVEPTPVKYFPDTTRELPINALQNQSITTPTSAPSTPTTAPYTPQTEFEKYWKTPVGTEKYNIPLDQFVRVAGLASKYLDPQNPVANDLIKMGNEAYNARARMEYESPNILLQRRLHEAQANIAERELGGQKAMGDYISSWPQRELSLKQKGIPKESIDKEFISGMIQILAPSSPEKAASLQEKMIEAEQNNKLRILAQNVKDAYNEVRLDIAKSGLDTRAEALNEQKKQNVIANKFRGREVSAREKDVNIRSTREDRIRSQIVEHSVNPAGQSIYRTTANKFYTVGENGELREATPEEHKNLTGKGYVKKEKENPFRRSATNITNATTTANKVGPSSYKEAFDKIKAANPSVTDEAIANYIKTTYPEIK